MEIVDAEDVSHGVNKTLESTLELSDIIEAKKAIDFPGETSQPIWIWIQIDSTSKSKSLNKNTQGIVVDPAIQFQIVPKNTKTILTNVRVQF